jgi:hypothetical protein
MIEPVHIRVVIANYIADRDAEKFMLDFAKLSYNIHKSGSPEAISLANEIEFRLTDVALGNLSKEQLAESLKAL